LQQNRACEDSFTPEKGCAELLASKKSLAEIAKLVDAGLGQLSIIAEK
jgi:hypothetical protein